MSKMTIYISGLANAKKGDVDMEIIKTVSEEQDVQCCGPMSLIS